MLRSMSWAIDVATSVLARAALCQLSSRSLLTDWIETATIRSPIATPRAMAFRGMDRRGVIDATRTAQADGLQGGASSPIGPAARNLSTRPGGRSRPIRRRPVARGPGQATVQAISFGARAPGASRAAAGGWACALTRRGHRRAGTPWSVRDGRVGSRATAEGSAAPGRPSRHVQSRRLGAAARVACLASARKTVRRGRRCIWRRRRDSNPRYSF